ncbi:MAG: HlyC/CorC family transporter [Bacteroidales bacterium]|nr:HlyC/CorC family transporter [Bacteroidales bacterium]
MNDWIIVLITLVFSAFFSGMEIAFISSNKLMIELDKNKGFISGKILAYFVKNPSRILGTLLLGNNIALVIYGIAMADILEPIISRALGPQLNSDILVLLIQTIISTLIILITAEFIPKALFRLKSNAILKVFAIPVNMLYWFLYPFIRTMVGISELIITKIFRVSPSKEGYQFSPIDLDHYIREFVPDQKEETEVKQELQMLQNALGFKNVKLRECMVPRTDLTALEIGESIETIKKAFIDSGHSKILIYRDTIDNIIGFVHTSDVFNVPKDTASITRSIPIFPETMLVHNVLNTFIKEHKSIAVVVDEFGGTSGIVTLEDIIEEIFGEIEDEYDIEELTEIEINKDEYIFSARHEIDYLNENYKLFLPVSDEYETLGGLIIKIHESIPSVGEEIHYESFHFVIKEATETRIEKVYLKIDRTKD